MTHKEALDYLKNRISKLALNHKIGNRDIANLEIKEIVNCIEIHVIPTLQQALTELEALKRYPTSEEVCEALQGLASYIMYTDDNSDESASAIEWHGILKHALTELEELKKRDTPMKPVHKYNTLVHINYEETINEYYCNCGKPLYISRLTRGSGLGFGTNGEKHQYCSHCGQRLDWSEKDGK